MHGGMCLLPMNSTSFKLVLDILIQKQRLFGLFLCGQDLDGKTYANQIH